MTKQGYFWDKDFEFGTGTSLSRTVHTSTSHPLTVNWVAKDVLGTNGRIGMTAAPGKCHENGVTGIHRRSMDADLEVLVKKSTHKVVTLMEPLELAENAMDGLEAALQKRGIAWVHFPIRDVSIPTDLHRLRGVLQDVRESLVAGRNCVIHCRGGHGRTGLVVACLLTDFEHSADTAIQLVRTVRKGTIHNDAQADFVRLYANDQI